MASRFKSVPSQVNFPVLEKDLLEYWDKEKVVEKYLKKNQSSEKKFSFLDGPITANNPMGVHHAWGRTYKDLWQRFFNMKGLGQRFQNGFDEQGLWVEVEVEKELGLKNKKEIENLVPGNKFESLEKFINLCKDRVRKFSAIQTKQSKRLGYFMAWENSYHTSSEQNNYWIWHYLQVVWQKGWLYKGRDSVPWCPRCGTAISQHEMLTENYEETTHDSLYIEYPVAGWKNVFLLVWTTTPWTLPANVAVAVDPNKEYAVTTGSVAGNKYYLLKEAANKLDLKVVKTLKGKELVGLKYTSPFDHLPRVVEALGNFEHQVVATDPQILPVSEVEGTGLVHIAPGAGTEDFRLGKKVDLPVIEVIDEEANYLDGMEEFSGKNAKDDPTLIINYLREKNNGRFLFDVVSITHRYPACWRCKTELVWRVVNEWYIAMDRPSQNASDSKQTYREQMIEVAKKINWIPKWGLERELDWLKNMHDWLISKKRFWGLALPIWECHECGSFEVIGGEDELKERAGEGWDKFEGHSPHRPWIDQVKIKCSKCNGSISRVPDVGNPWLDAGIVPFSTMTQEWFPADFITESFPGQFKNWFYSLIAMSTALKNTNPFRSILGFATVLDEKGEEMHKSKGNMVEFNEAADKAGVDVMRWLYVTQNPEVNLKFGYTILDEIRRKFYLILWNTYKFFADYANLADWSCEFAPTDIKKKLTVLDKWVLARLTEVVFLSNRQLEKYDAMVPSRAIENFVVDDLSTWYIRRSRDRVGVAADKEDERVFLSTLYGVLVTLSKLLAPFTPFMAEEIYRNLTGYESVHLADYPAGDKSLLDHPLIEKMEEVRKLVEIGHGQRKKANIKLRQPLPKFVYFSINKLNPELEKILGDELNVKQIEYKYSSTKEPMGKLSIELTQQLISEGEVRELIRRIQQQRKEMGLTPQDKITVITPHLPKDPKFKKLVLTRTNALQIHLGDTLKIMVEESQ